MTRLMRARSCSGFRATTIWIVEQFGLATIPLGMLRRASALTSGTTSGTSGSMRQALELSTTIAPARAAIGENSRLIDAGVLDRTISTPAKASGRNSSTGYDLPWNSIALPALRSEARNLMERRGNLCSLNTCRMISPTAPVAPTTATPGTTIQVPFVRGGFRAAPPPGQVSGLTEVADVKSSMISLHRRDTRAQPNRHTCRFPQAIRAVGQTFLSAPRSCAICKLFSPSSGFAPRAVSPLLHSPGRIGESFRSTDATFPAYNSFSRGLLFSSCRMPGTGRRDSLPVRGVPRHRVRLRPAGDILRRAMKILAIDIGGTNVKVKCSEGDEARRFPSGKELSAQQMVDGVQELTKDWSYDVLTAGFPGPIVKGQIVQEPVNLGKGWVGFDFTAAFGKPTRLINDAAMQA